MDGSAGGSTTASDADVGQGVDPGARLALLDTCAVSDALDQLGLGGVVTGLRPLAGDYRIAGRVVTVLLGPPDASIASAHLCTAAIEAAAPGDVLVVAHQGRTDCAGWGGNLSRAARVKELAGTIVDGAARDIDECREVGYRLFALAATPRTARGRTQELAWGVPVDISGNSVATGDFAIADGSGVAFISAESIDAVLEAAERIARKEAVMAAAIERGEPVSAVMGADYETMLQATSPASTSEVVHG